MSTEDKTCISGIPKIGYNAPPHCLFLDRADSTYFWTLVTCFQLWHAIKQDALSAGSRVVSLRAAWEVVGFPNCQVASGLRNMDAWEAANPFSPRARDSCPTYHSSACTTFTCDSCCMLSCVQLHLIDNTHTKQHNSHLALIYTL